MWNLTVEKERQREEEGERKKKKPCTDFAGWSCVKTADQKLFGQLSTMIWTGEEESWTLCLKADPSQTQTQKITYPLGI